MSDHPHPTKKKMTGPEFRRALRLIGFSQTDFADVIGYNPSHISQMCNGKSPVPYPLELLIRIILKFPEARSYIIKLSELEDRPKIKAMIMDDLLSA